MADSEVMNMV